MDKTETESQDNNAEEENTNVQIDSEQKDTEIKNNENEKANKYVEKLMAEKLALDVDKYPNSIKLLKQEIEHVQQSGRSSRAIMYVTAFKNRPIRLVTKVIVPVKNFPGINFVGKLLGPKGSIMKQLQEDTMCKMAIYGRGSMKDRKKEEELRNSLDPKYSHLTEDLHVEVAALAPPAEAYARLAYGLTELQKVLQPDENEMLSLQMIEGSKQRMPGGPGGRGRGRGAAGPSRGGPPTRGARGGPIRGGVMRGGPGRSGPGSRGMPAKAKVLSILDRARSSMDYEESYDDYSMNSFGGYGDGYDDFEGDYYGGGGDGYGEHQPRWNSGNSSVMRSYEGGRFRSAPYSRR